VRGSFNSFKVLSPVLVKVAVTLRFSTPSAASAPDTFNDRPGAAIALALTASKAANTLVENILEYRGGEEKV